MKFLLLISILFLGSHGYARSFIEVKTKADGFNLDYKTERKIEQGILRIYSDFRNILGIDYRNSPIVRNTIFTTEEEYLTFSKRFNLPLDTHSGFYTRSTNTAYTWNHSDQDKLLAIIMHESTHRLIDRKFPRCPTWLNEGMASFYEGIKINNNMVTIKPSQGRDTHLKYLIQNSNLPDIKNFILGDRNQFYKFGDIGYSVAWSLTYFMMSSNVGKDLINSIYKNSKARYKESLDKVFERNYNGGINKFIAHWREWNQQDRSIIPVTMYY